MTHILPTQKDAASNPGRFTWAKVYESAETQTIDPGAGEVTTNNNSETSPPTCEYTTKVRDGYNWHKDTSTGCEWVKDSPAEGGNGIPTGYIEFGGYQGQCKNYFDTATGSTYFAAYINSGSWIKMVMCEGSNPDEYWSGSYRHIEGRATVSGTTCTGEDKTKYNAPHRFSCNPNSYDSRGGEYFLQDTANYKWFDPQGKYYCISSPPSGWHWSGTAWVENSTSTPSPTVTV